MVFTGSCVARATAALVVSAVLAAVPGDLDTHCYDPRGKKVPGSYPCDPATSVTTCCPEGWTIASVSDASFRVPPPTYAPRRVAAASTAAHSGAAATAMPTPPRPAERAGGDDDGSDRKVRLGLIGIPAAVVTAALAFGCYLWWQLKKAAPPPQGSDEWSDDDGVTEEEEENHDGVSVREESRAGQPSGAVGTDEVVTREGRSRGFFSFFVGHS